MASASKLVPSMDCWGPKPGHLTAPVSRSIHIRRLERSFSKSSLPRRAESSPSSSFLSLGNKLLPEGFVQSAAGAGYSRTIDPKGDRSTPAKRSREGFLFLYKPFISQGDVRELVASTMFLNQSLAVVQNPDISWGLHPELRELAGRAGDRFTRQPARGGLD